MSEKQGRTVSKLYRGCQIRDTQNKNFLEFANVKFGLLRIKLKANTKKNSYSMCTLFGTPCTLFSGGKYTQEVHSEKVTRYLLRNIISVFCDFVQEDKLF